MINSPDVTRWAKQPLAEKTSRQRDRDSGLLDVGLEAGGRRESQHFGITCRVFGKIAVILNISILNMI